MQVGDTLSFHGEARRAFDGQDVTISGPFTVTAIDTSRDDPIVTLVHQLLEADADEDLTSRNTYTVAQSLLTAPAAAAADDPRRAAFVAGAQWMGSQLLPAGSQLLQLDDQAVDAALAAVPAPAGPSV